MKRYSALWSVMFLGLLFVRVARSDEKAQDLDKDFLIKAAVFNHAEIEFGKLAAKRAAESKVKDLAERLIKEHQASYDKLAELLKTRKIGVVAGTEKETRDEVKRLAKLEGGEFDREFVHRLVLDHKKAVTLFEGQAKNGREADIRQYARETLPKLRQHRKKVEQLEKNLSK